MGIEGSSVSDKPPSLLSDNDDDDSLPDRVDLNIPAPATKKKNKRRLRGKKKKNASKEVEISGPEVQMSGMNITKSASPKFNAHTEAHINAVRDTMNYWNHIASLQLEAQLLVRRIGLRFPNPPYEPFYGGTKYPLWRLITMGEDTPDNIAMLLGPSWKECVGNLYEDWRIEALVSPFPSLGSTAFIERQYLDEGSPRWSPREATVQEQKRIDQFSEISKTLLAGEKHG